VNVLSIFGKSQPTPPAAMTTAADRLAEIERAYRVADTHFVDACSKVARHRSLHQDMRFALINGQLQFRIGAMDREPALRTLEAARDEALRERNRLLDERARALKNLGLIR
jgi:hypothetical protein